MMDVTLAGFADKSIKLQEVEVVNRIFDIDLSQTRLDDLQTDFEEERVAKPQAMFDKSADERKRIAEANKAERINVIEPLRKRIEAFAQTVTAEIQE